jgi:hypothetical protein
MKIPAVALALCSLTHLASADDHMITLDRTCVELDEAADKLAVTERDYALGMFRQVLERADLLVVTGGCTETYRVSHEQVDNQYVIHVASSAGKRRMTTPSLQDLSSKYGKLVHALIDAKAAQAAAAAAPPPAHAPVATAAAAEPADGLEPLPTADAMPPTTTTTTTPTDTETPATEKPAHMDRMLYAMAGLSFGGGTGLMGGYRRDLDNLTLDFSVVSRNGGGTGTSGFSAGAEVLRNTWMSPKTQAYGGGGLSIGAEDSSSGNGYGGSYSGAGLQGELTAGLRIGSRNGDLLVQLDFTIPFYEMGDYQGNKYYAAAGVISGGIGF